MNGKFSVILLTSMSILGGWWHGLVYFPSRWPSLVVEGVPDLGAIAVGALVGALLSVVILALTELWKS